MSDTIFLWIANNFSSVLYMDGLKVGALCCGLADILVIVFMTRSMDIIMRRKSPKALYAALAIFALLMPLHLIPKNSTHFFIVMFFVFLPPYVILVWRITVEAGDFIAHVKIRNGRPEKQ